MKHRRENPSGLDRFYDLLGDIGVVLMHIVAGFVFGVVTYRLTFWLLFFVGYFPGRIGKFEHAFWTGVVGAGIGAIVGILRSRRDGW